jgi:hypothetical protein
MASASPYQPSLLRLLHGLMAALVALAWITGLTAYCEFDGRIGRLPLHLPEVIDLHGSLGVGLILVSCLFVPYALTLGRTRLRQAANAVALLALLLCLGSGLLMDEEWLEHRDFGHLPYHLHLLAWLLLSAAVIWHLLALLGRGGPALVTSMLQLRLRPGDRPGDWPGQLCRFFGFPPATQPRRPPD